MAHFIYAEELTSLKHGHPLWEPDCRPEVSIADVGYTHNGQFCRLFNASLPLGDPGNIYGEPDGFEPLHIGAIQTRAPHPPGAMVSRSVSKKGAEMEISASIVQAGGAGFQFSCKKDRGAVLIINSEAHRKDALRLGAFKDYMVRHYKSWLKLANNEANDRDISLSDIVFVTGCDNTADWAAATFSERSTTGGVSFEAGYPAIAGANFSIWGSWKQTTSVHAHCGPRIPRDGPVLEQTAPAENTAHPVCAADLQEYNQCVFLRGFRILDKKTQVRKKVGLKVKGSHGGLNEVQEPWIQRTPSGDRSDSSSVNKSRSSSDGGSWGKRHMQLSPSSTVDGRIIEVVSNNPRGTAPVESLLWYILENSKADIAVAHDDDLTQIIKGDDESQDFNTLVCKAKPRICVDSEGVGTLSGERTLSVSIPESPVTAETSVSQSLKESPLSSSAIFPSDVPQAASSTTDIPTKLGYKPDLEALRGPKRSSTYKFPAQPPPTSTLASEKPDSAAYNTEQERIKSEIGVLEVQLSMARDRISLTTKTGRGADRRSALRAQLDTLRDQKLENENTKKSELKPLQEEIRQKIKDLQAMSKKLTAKSVEDLDSQIRTLERKVDSGTMSPAGEKKVLGQISSLRRSRTAIEKYQALQSAVDADRAKADTLRRQLDAESNTHSERFNAVRAELDSLQRQSNEAFANRPKLYEERDNLQARILNLHEQKRRSVERFKGDCRAYQQKVDEDRAQQAQKAREERAAQEEQRRIQARERLLEKARAPAFAAEIHDCRSLLEYFSASGKVEQPASSSASPTEEVFSQAKHHLRQPVENHPGAGWVPLKKKEEDTYFVGGKGKAKKGQRKGAPSTSTKISVPLGILSTLLSLSIAPPAVAADIPRTLEDLHKKIEWFEVNQQKATEENVARTEADLHRIALPTRNVSVAIGA